MIIHSCTKDMYQHKMLSEMWVKYIISLKPWPSGPRIHDEVVILHFNRDKKRLHSSKLWIKTWWQQAKVKNIVFRELKFSVLCIILKSWPEGLPRLWVFQDSDCGFIGFYNTREYRSFCHLNFSTLWQITGNASQVTTSKCTTEITTSKYNLVIWIIYS